MGSEMCIRDRPWACSPPSSVRKWSAAFEGAGRIFLPELVMSRATGEHMAPAVCIVGSMKSIFPAVWLSICLLITFQAEGVLAASVTEKPAASATSKKPAPVKKAAPVKKKAAKVKKRPPIASKSKSASEIAKTKLPSADLDLSLP